jgi:hypothetical protein
MVKEQQISYKDTVLRVLYSAVNFHKNGSLDRNLCLVANMNEDKENGLLSILTYI